LYHALNRGNLRADIFKTDADFAAFEQILHEGLAIHDVELYAWQLMSNHYHLVLRPLVDGEMSRFMGWIGAGARWTLVAKTRTRSQTAVTVAVVVVEASWLDGSRQREPHETGTGRGSAVGSARQATGRRSLGGVNRTTGQP